MPDPRVRGDVCHGVVPHAAVSRRSLAGILADPVRTVIDETVTSHDVLLAWRDAGRAAELARRLADVADTAAATAEHDPASLAELSTLTETAADDAMEAAASARATGDRIHRAAEIPRIEGDATSPRWSPGGTAMGEV